MHPLDFISEAPNLFIFQRESNKTNFGGFLFFIYLIIIIFICIYYIIDYKKSNKYVIQSFSHFNFRNEEKIRERNKDILYNPYITFKLDLSSYIYDEDFLVNKFKLFNAHNNSFLNRNTSFTERVSDFDLEIYYECESPNCSDFDELLKNFSSNFYLNLEYDGFYLDHQNKVNPIIKKTDDNNYTFKEYYKLNLNYITSIDIQWKNILYTEKRIYSKNDYNDSCGYIEKYNALYFDFKFRVNSSLLLISHIRFINDNTQYTEYIRKRISEFDIIANILSLISNLYFGAKIILKFYSKNFNNFKIIEKLLNKNLKIKSQIDKPLEIDKIKNTIENNENNKFINNINIDDNNLIQNINDSEKDDDSSTESNIKIRKLHCYDFFLNNIYCCCFKKKKSQKLIHMCNKIVYKYAGIDSIIKNQILLENFFKDYKWNDPVLNNIENNDLFIQLETYL